MNRFLIRHRKGTRLIAGLAVMVVLFAAACGTSATPEATATLLPAATSVPTPTAATLPAATTLPTSTTSPADTPAATLVPTPVAATQPAATTMPPGTPAPTKTEIPTATVPPATPTAEPVVTPEATSTPVPTPTQETVATPDPTSTGVPPTGEPQIEGVTRTVTLGPSKDNTLYQASSSFTSNGSGQHLFAGNTSSGSARRALLAFDVSGAIPEGATINSVTLTLNMSRTVADVQEIGLRRLLAGWGEGGSDTGGNEGSGTAAATGDATWVHTIFDTEEWETPGGDFSSLAAATQQVGGVGKYTWDSTDEMVSDVQSWHDDPSTNFGWLLIGNETANRTTKRFDSRENGDEGKRPVLTVEFTSRE